MIEMFRVSEEKGYTHSCGARRGHFIGQDDHEFGEVSPINHNPAAVGNISSIEPGIYLPGEFGVRIEDLVCVTDDGCEVLNSYPRELAVLGPR